MSTKPPTFLFAAGGTGGHIFPALAIASELKKKYSNANIQFVGTKNGLEKKIIPQHNFPLHLLTVGRLNRNVAKIERMFTLLSLPLAFLQAFFLIIRLRPLFILGVGGHASGPLLLVGSLLGRKTFIWEPNAFPGMANRHLAKHVDKAYVLFAETLKNLSAKKTKTVGYPVRDRIENTTRIKSQRYGRVKVFIFGGSQGSQAINQVLWDLIEGNEKFLERAEVVHQAGARDFAAVKARYEKLSEESKQRVHLFEFVDEMEKYYQWADFAICRSGMGTVAELAAMGLPGILIPLPTAADNHQQMNAEEMVKAEASIMILQEELTIERLNSEMQNLIDHPDHLDLMAENIHKFYRPKAAQEIVEDMLLEAKE